MRLYEDQMHQNLTVENFSFSCPVWTCHCVPPTFGHTEMNRGMTIHNPSTHQSLFSWLVYAPTYIKRIQKRSISNYQGLPCRKLTRYGKPSIRRSFFDTIGFHRLFPHLFVGFPRVYRLSTPVLCNDTRCLLRGVAVEEAT